MAEEKPLKFKVAPHIVEDLGLNLYTSLPRVLVEFVANAYDADAGRAFITFDRKAIDTERKVVKADFDKERALADAKGDDLAQEKLKELGTRTLGDAVRITIRDDGLGMSREELQEKFLIAGRRRRLEGETTSPSGRVIMGRKGVGKLAGFGVAKRVEVISKKLGDKKARCVVLDYDTLVKGRTTDEIDVPDYEIDDPQLGDSGTKIVLSQLLYDPMKARETTIENDIADHFQDIDPGDFEVRVNGVPIVATPRTLVYAWPDVGGYKIDDFIAAETTVEGDDEDKSNPRTVKFKYRLRFTKQSLKAAERGVRVYASKRLAAAPSLLDAPTGMHGFRMTDYLDGVVHADFIDEQATDYIATDRHSLRWEAPLLAAMRKYLSEQIVVACKARQDVRDREREKETDSDDFTKSQLQNSDLTSRERKVLRTFATALSKSLDQGTEDPTYKATLPQVASAIGQGGIIAAITKLAEQEHPQLEKLVVQLTRLTRDELEGFARRARARLMAIRTLKRVVEAADFRKSQNEGKIQRLLEQNPWLIDPTYTQFLTANQKIDSLFDRLAQYLKISKHAGSTLNPKKRPDLVFLLGNLKLGRLVIVELKSTNLQLDNSHLDQLNLYIEDAERWLKKQGEELKVEGQLIGTLGEPDVTKDSVMLLERSMRIAGPTAQWKVRDYLQLLREAEAAHEELLDVQGALAEEDKEDADDDDA